MKIALINDFKESIKSPDTEEKLDLILYRPVGFIIAKIANVFKMTPVMLSIIGLILGIVSSYYFLDYKNNSSLLLASFYFVLSGILDSSDGQLARISNQSTKAGLIIDGICDSLVIIAIYITCSLPFIKIYGPMFIIIVFIALYQHSYQCAILDFYHREYLYFGYGKTQDETYWNPGVEDGIILVRNSSTSTEKFLNKLRMGWIKKQQHLTTRTAMQRSIMRNYLLDANVEQKKFFMEKYKMNNLKLLPYWRLVGVNAHTVAIITFMFLRRFDIYLIVLDLILFNIIIYVVGFFQNRADKKFMKELELVFPPKVT